MRRHLKILESLLLVLLVGVAAIITATAHAGVVVNPLNPTDSDTLEVTITAWCCTTPITIASVDVEVSEMLITIETDRICGPQQAPRQYTHTVLVPPVEAGDYSIEYWVTGDCSNVQANPIYDIALTVLSSSTPLAGTTWGAIKALYK